MRPSLLFLALFPALLLLPCAAVVASGDVAADDPDAAGATEFHRMVVTATRNQRAIVDVPNTVDVIERERMDALLVRDLKDLFRYEPGVTVSQSYGRFGIGDIRIRGLGGNRVRILTDGIPVSDAFGIGSFSNANRNFVDLDTLKRVEVVRGPSSSLYGSDALGGVVSFVTRDPSDYLEPGRDAHFGFKLGAESDWDGLFAGATAAFGGDRWSGLVAVGHRQGQQTRNKGGNDAVGAARTAPNPQARQAGVRTGCGPAPAADGGGQRGQRRNRHAEHARAAGADRRGQRADARRRPPDPRAHGLQVNFYKAFETGGARHDLTWGIDASRTETRQKRDGLVTDLVTGETGNAMLPDVFPVRDFPVSVTTTYALYAQDEIAFGDDGRFRLVPGLRVDRYELRPELDDIFAEDNPGVAVSDLSHTQVSPKLGAVWKLADRWSLFAGYARGFRAPPYSDVNIGFTNVMFGYTAIANPDLRPETSDGFEAGVRFVGDAAYASLTGYHNRYEDFIESFRFIGMNEQGLMVYQSQNVAQARIHGVELKAGVDLGALSPGWQGWSLRGAAAWSRGEDRTAGVPLDTVDPPTAAFGVAYATDAWGAELAGRLVAKKKRVSDPELYRTPGYGVLDLYAHWNFAPGARLNAGLLNLADRRYWAAGDLPLVAATSGVLDRFTAPGRSVAVSLSVEF